MEKPPVCLYVRPSVRMYAMYTVRTYVCPPRLEALRQKKDCNTFRFQIRKWKLPKTPIQKVCIPAWGVKLNVCFYLKGQMLQKFLVLVFLLKYKCVRMKIMFSSLNYNFSDFRAA